MPLSPEQLAYARLKSDNKSRVFYRHPYELALVELASREWIADVQGLAARGESRFSQVYSSRSDVLM